MPDAGPDNPFSQQTTTENPTPTEHPSPERPAPERPSPEKKAFFDKRLNERPERFEDYAPWQEARRFVNRMFEATEREDLAAAPGVRDELRGAAIEVMSQLAAGVESGHDRAFTYSLNQAASAAARARSLMYVISDRSQFAEAETNELVARANSLKQMIQSQLARLKRADLRNSNRKSGGPGGPGGKPGRPGGKKPPFRGNSGKKPGGWSRGR